MTSTPNRLLITAALAAVVGLSFQGSRGLYETTEGRYAEVGREMAETGDWWTPRLDYEPHWTKPPLTYWMVGAGIAVLGANEWGARVGNGLLLVALALATAWLGSLLWDAETGAVAGLVYATSLFPVVATGTLSTDALLSLWELLAVGAYWAGARSPPSRSARWGTFMWAILGLAFLTKGPPGLLGLLVLVVYHWTAKRRGWPRGRMVTVGGLLLFGALGLGWYLDEVLRNPGLLGYFLGQEVLARVATDTFHRNAQWYKPPLIYGPPLLLGLGGWLLALWRRRSGRGTLRSGFHRVRTAPRPFFLALWVALPVVILSLSRSRLPLYVLPFYPALALAAARILRNRVGPGEDAWRTALRWAIGMAVVLVAIKAVSARVTSTKDMRPVYRAVVAARADMAADAASRADARPTPVVAVDEDQLYGLQFYLRGTMKRAVTEPSSEEARPGIAAYLSARRAAEGARPQAGFLVVSHRREAVEEALAALADARWQEVASPGRYRVWRVTPEAATYDEPPGG